MSDNEERCLTEEEARLYATEWADDDFPCVLLRKGTCWDWDEDLPENAPAWAKNGWEVVERLP